MDFPVWVYLFYGVVLLIQVIGFGGFIACAVYAAQNSGIRKQAPWAIWSLLLGFASVSLTGKFELFFTFTYFKLAGPFAVWTGIQSKRQGENNRMATAGIILGCVGLLGILIGFLNRIM